VDIAAAEAEHKRVLADVEASVTAAKARVVSLTQQLERLQASKPIEEMTVKDAVKQYPDLREKFGDRLKKAGWD